MGAWPVFRKCDAFLEQANGGDGGGWRYCTETTQEPSEQTLGLSSDKTSPLLLRRARGRGRVPPTLITTVIDRSIAHHLRQNHRRYRAPPKHAHNTSSMRFPKLLARHSLRGETKTALKKKITFHSRVELFGPRVDLLDLGRPLHAGVDVAVEVGVHDRHDAGSAASSAFAGPAGLLELLRILELNGRSKNRKKKKKKRSSEEIKEGGERMLSERARGNGDV